MTWHINSAEKHILGKETRIGVWLIHTLDLWALQLGLWWKIMKQE
jgi:hypothetical protein